MNEQHEIDWLGSPDVEAVPGRCGGRPTIKGTRIEPDVIVQDFELGASVEEIHDNFPTVPVDTIKNLLAFAQTHPQLQP